MLYERQLSSAIFAREKDVGAGAGTLILNVSIEMADLNTVCKLLRFKRPPTG